MLTRWMFSQMFRDSNQTLVPVCSAYCGWWICPRHPTSDDGWALVLVDCYPQQLEAAGQDPRVVVCPLVFDPRPAPQAVLDAYKEHGAADGMNMGTLIATLAEWEPLYGTQQQ